MHSTACGVGASATNLASLQTNSYNQQQQQQQQQQFALQQQQQQSANKCLVWPPLLSLSLPLPLPLPLPQSLPAVDAAAQSRPQRAPFLIQLTSSQRCDETRD
ncbi:hypothetical protein ACLKA7_006263 [Drosophila subpalustris]